MCAYAILQPLIFCYVMQTNDWSMWQNHFWRNIITQSYSKASLCSASSTTVSWCFTNRNQMWCHDLRIVWRGLSISWNHLSLTNKRTGTIILVNYTFRGGKMRRHHAVRSRIAHCFLISVASFTDAQPTRKTELTDHQHVWKYTSAPTEKKTQKLYANVIYVFLS